MLLAHDVMKVHQDCSRRDLEFAVHDWVWLRLHQRSALGITAASPSKLAPHFYGPFQVLVCIGEVSYRLRLPESSKIHDVFHVSLLKKFTGSPPVEPVQLPPIVRGRVIPVPEKVIRACLNRGVWELLVQWKSSHPADAAWELLSSFVAAYPDFQLEDALFLGEGGNVINAFVGKVYQHRRPAAGPKKTPEMDKEAGK